MPADPLFIDRPMVRGWLHQATSPRAALALTHGAGGNCEARLLIAVAEAFAQSGYCVLRYDLPFRQQSPHGPPRARQERDREGIRRAAEELRSLAGDCPLYLAGHSYGGRQTTMLAAEDPVVAAALLLLSYPLHPPTQPAALRTQHFPAVRVPALFVHGTRDAFGSIAEMEQALATIPARTKLVPVQGAGHGLSTATATSLPGWFAEFQGQYTQPPN